MRNPRVLVAEALLAGIVLLGAVYVGGDVLDVHLLHRPFTVDVALTGAGGLHDRSEVTYRGHRVGEVKDVSLTDDGVRAVLSLDHGVDVPADTEAVVANLSAVGEQYLDLRPRSDGPPYLADGDTVAAADTRLPLPAARLLADTHDLVTHVDPRELRTVSHELGVAFGDPRLDLLTMSQQTDSTLAMLERLRPATLRLVETGRTPLRTTVEHGADIRTFATGLDQLTAEMRSADPTLRTLLRRGDVLAPELDALLRRTRGSATRLLVAGAVPADVLAARQPALNAWLDWAPLETVAMAGSTEGGHGRVTLIPNPSPNCHYAVREHSPTSTTRRPAPRDAHCTLRDPVVQQRGAQNAPRPR